MSSRNSSISNKSSSKSPESLHIFNARNVQIKAQSIKMVTPAEIYENLTPSATNFHSSQGKRKDDPQN